MLCTTPSNRLSRANNSASGGFLLRLGALPGPGNTHSIPCLLQLEHGCRLSQRTFRFLHVVHDRGFNEFPFAAPSDGEAEVVAFAFEFKLRPPFEIDGVGPAPLSKTWGPWRYGVPSGDGVASGEAGKTDAIDDMAMSGYVSDGGLENGWNVKERSHWRVDKGECGVCFVPCSGLGFPPGRKSCPYLMS